MMEPKFCPSCQYRIDAAAAALAKDGTRSSIPTRPGHCCTIYWRGVEDGRRVDQLNSLEPTSADLLPCPFCGSTEVDVGHAEFGEPAVCCGGCGAVGPGGGHREDTVGAAQLWNKRT